MTLLVIIVTNGLNGIPFRSFASIFILVALQSVGCINPGGRDGILRPSFLVVPLPFLFLLILLPSLLRGLNAIGALRSWGFLFLGLGFRFFNPWVLHWLALGTGFGCWRSTTLKAVLIGIASIRARLEGGFGFGVNSFFDYFFKAIKFSAALLHFNLHWRPEAFSEVLNYCTFLWGTIPVELNQDGL